MPSIERCAVCKDLFNSRHLNHVVCGDPACKKKWYAMPKKEKEAILGQRRITFTQTQKELLVECIEFRKNMTMKKIAQEVFSTEKAIAAEIERMKAVGEYEKIKAIVRKQRTK